MNCVHQGQVLTLELSQRAFVSLDRGALQQEVSLSMGLTCPALHCMGSHLKSNRASDSPAMICTKLSASSVLCKEIEEAAGRKISCPCLVSGRSSG